jgi:hypothetical protein
MEKIFSHLGRQRTFMDFWSNVLAILGTTVVAANVVFFLWWLATIVLGKLQFTANMHDLDMAYLISKEDRDSLTRAEYKSTKQMSFTELQAYLKERFPDSIPEIRDDNDDS